MLWPVDRRSALRTSQARASGRMRGADGNCIVCARCVLVLRAHGWCTLVVLVALVLADCAGLDSGRREEREARINVFPDTYKADVLAALHAYLADPTNVRDAYISNPVIRPIGGQNRYGACVRFNARNSDGRYVGSRDIMALFASGRFEQFIDQAGQPAQSPQASIALQAKEACGQAEYSRFPELEALKR